METMIFKVQGAKHHIKLEHLQGLFFQDVRVQITIISIHTVQLCQGFLLNFVYTIQDKQYK